MSPDMREDIDHILFSEEEIAQKVAALGKQITEDYRGRNPLVVAVLRGAVTFAADIFRRLDTPAEIDFMAVSSYGKSTQSSGHVSIIKDLSTSILDRDVLIVEDILDTGNTLKYLMENLASRKPRSMEIAALLLKNKQPVVTPKYVGFECPDEFVVGYGLDFAQMYRNLPYIGVLKPEVYQTIE